MKDKKPETHITGTDKEMLSLFESLCGRINTWQAWSGIIDTIAIAFSNVLDPDQKRKAKREAEYQNCISQLGGMEPAVKALSIITQALERDPNQDFMGKIFMQLDLGSHWHGQFFTPYNLASSMAEMSVGEDFIRDIKKNGWASVCDPACGAGATLIGAANALQKKNVNYQERVIFVGQDIERTTAQMCYIQLSLLGCAGYVVVADTLTSPVRGPVLNPIEEEGQEFWYTPMWWSDVWTARRLELAIRTAVRRE